MAYRLHIWGNVLIWWEFVCSSRTSTVTDRSDLGSQFTDDRSPIVSSICRRCCLTRSSSDSLRSSLHDLFRPQRDDTGAAGGAGGDDALSDGGMGQSFRKKIHQASMNHSLAPSFFTASCIPRLCALMSRRYGYSFEREDRQKRSLSLRERQEIQALLPPEATSVSR